MLQQLRAFLDGGGREAIEQIPDGIHSGLQRAGARGVFFYFKSSNNGKAQNFWKYIDLKNNTVLDNRHVLATLIACSHDTPRIVDQEIYKSVFALQEKVLENLLQGHEEQTALQTTPQAIDPLQQTISTVVQQFLNHPQVERKRAISAIEFLNGPMQNVQVAELRKIYKAYQQTQSIQELIAAIEAMRSTYGVDRRPQAEQAEKSLRKLNREDLRLVCFDVLSDG